MPLNPGSRPIQRSKSPQLAGELRDTMRRSQETFADESGMTAIMNPWETRILRGKLNLNVSSIDLAVTIQGAIETVRLAAEAKSITVEANLDSEVGSVAGDSTRLQQVVWNLLSNAVKFTPSGGRVEVRL
nr:ATP-binding protein [Oculatella sp. LEGE 06141]